MRKFFDLVRKKWVKNRKNLQKFALFYQKCSKMCAGSWDCHAALAMTEGRGEILRCAQNDIHWIPACAGMTGKNIEQGTTNKEGWIPACAGMR